MIACPSQRARRLAALLAVTAMSGGAAAGPALATAPATATVALKVAGSRAPYFVVHARPGQTVARSALVINVGRSAGWVTLYPTDAVTGATSGAVYLSQRAPRSGVGGWLRLSATRVRLAPRQAVRVAFTLRIPRRVGAGEHLGGIVAEPDAPQAVLHGRRGRAAFGVKVREQSVIAVQVDLPGPSVQRLAATGVSAGAQPGTQTILVGLRSGGDLLTRGSMQLTVRDARGAVRTRRRVALDTFVPGTSIKDPVTLTGRPLGPGRYTARVVLRWRTGSQTRVFGFIVTRRDVTQVYGSRTASLLPRGGSGADLTPWLIAGGLALVLTLGIGYLVGTRARQRPARS